MKRGNRGICESEGRCAGGEDTETEKVRNKNEGTRKGNM